MKYRVVVTETQCYEVQLEAESEAEAEEQALECYGCEGDIFSTLTNVGMIEEVNG